MFPEQNHLKEDEEAAFRERLSRVESTAKVHRERALKGIESDSIRAQLDRILFTTEGRTDQPSSPDVYLHLLVESLYCGADSEEKHLARVHQSTALLSHYTTMLPSLLTDPPEDEFSRTEVFVAALLAVSRTTEILGAIGNDANTYAMAHLRDVLLSLTGPPPGKPTREAYRELLDRQTHRYAGPAGLAGIAAGADEETVRTYEEIGASYYRYNQVIVDLERSVESERTDPWNAWEVFGAEATRLIGLWREEIVERIESLPDHHAKPIEALVSVDPVAYKQFLQDEM